MKKIKIKQRIENSVNAFFADTSLNENNSMDLAGGAEIWRSEPAAVFFEKSDRFVNILRQVFLFFPGTFVLFIISFGSSLILVTNRFNVTIPSNSLVWAIFLSSTAFFMTWLGIGDARKPKHFVVPFSIIATGVVIGATSAILSTGFYGFQKLVWSNAYPLYFFPLALIVPFLAKGLVDRKDES